MKLPLILLCAAALPAAADLILVGGTSYLPIYVSAAGVERYDKPVEIELDFTAALLRDGKTGTFDETSLRLVEVSTSGKVLGEVDPIQFDKASGYDARTAARGTLIFIMAGTTPADATRYYRVHFSDVPRLSPVRSARAAPQVSTVKSYQGQDAFKIVTDNATYYYHKQGAGFASLIDENGKDWITYKPTGGSAGSYRGIPNMGYSEGYMHPGKTRSTSTIENNGPIKVTIYSESTDKKWSGRWEIYPTYATMTVLKVSHNYWFLYEGTPGGVMEPSSDTWTLSDGSSGLLSKRWTKDLPSPEWVYFSDGKLNRSLFLAHHENDSGTDSFYQMNSQMTVFGFGRSGMNKYMKTVPSHFTIGLVNARDSETVAKLIDSAVKGLIVGTPTPPAITAQPKDVQVVEGKTATFTVTATGDPAPTYQWQKNGGNILGATQATYTTASATTADNGAKFRVQVANSEGSVTSLEATLTVTAALKLTPTAKINASLTLGTVGQALTFDGEGSIDLDGTIAAYDWDFGDGTLGTGALGSHSWMQPGTYTVKLTVIDNEGLKDTDTLQVVIGKDTTDTRPPTVSFSMLGIGGTVDDATVTAVLVDGTSFAIAGGAFGAEASLGPVPDTIAIEAIPASGAAATLTLRID